MGPSHRYGQSPSWRDPSGASNGDPISVTRDPIVDPNVAPIGDPIWDPIVFLRTASNKIVCEGVRRGLGWSVWRRRRRRELRRVSCHLGPQLGPSKTIWVPIRSLQTKLGPSEAGFDNDEVR